MEAKAGRHDVVAVRSACYHNLFRHVVYTVSILVCCQHLPKLPAIKFVRLDLGNGNILMGVCTVALRQPI